MSDVSVIIPTFQRPDSLAKAARSVFAQQAPGCSYEVVIVDNCPDGSAAGVIEILKTETEISVRAEHAPAPGVANARNAGWAAAHGGLIAFLDDDETAEPDWLVQLLAARERLNAPVVFGRVSAVLPEDAGAHRAFVERFFSRDAGEEECLLDDYYGCGGTLIDRAALGLSEPPFDAANNEIGGEDDQLFDPLMRAGTRFGWAPEARVWEHVPRDRARLSYVLRKSFAFGQSPSQACASRRPPDVVGVLFWMGVGLGQLFGFGLAAAGAWVIRSPARARLLDRAVQGLGKVLWQPVFVPRFYGRAALKRRSEAP